MSYSTGMLRHRITIQNRKAATQSKFGIDSTGPEYEDICTVWASVDFVRGLRTMREGAIDVYGIVMVRTRYNSVINERSRIVFEGKTYNVLGETLHVDHQGNIVQFNAQVIINDKVPTPPSGAAITGGSRNQQIIGA